MMPDHPEFAALKKQAVVVANEVGKTLTGDFAEVEKLVEANAVVFAVWPDAEEPDGVGLMIVKGQQRLRSIIANGRRDTVKFTAIPCIEAEQAMALKRVAGERDGRH